jgi:hypothetical protein
MTRDVEAAAGNDIFSDESNPRLDDGENPGG